MKLERGLIQVYTGNGKGKTTAALGQGLRSCGRGLKVYMVQFLKTGDTGELHSIEKLAPNFKVFRFEKPRGFFWTLNDNEREALKSEVDDAICFVQDIIKNSECDILILDEILGSLSNKLVDLNKLVGILKAKPENMEIILTGRNVPDDIVQIADLVTEMKEIKHYYKNGIGARVGIEE